MFNVDQFLLFAECFAEPMLLVAENGDIITGNTPARIALELSDAQPSHNLADYIQETTMGLSFYLQQCANSSRAVLGSFKALSDHWQMMCLGQVVESGHEGSPILLRCTASVEQSDDLTALNLRLERLQQEIEQREHIMAELQASQAHAKAVLDTAVEGIITINEHGIVQSFNRAAESIFGYEADEIIGGNVSQLMPTPYRAEHDHYLHDYLTTGEKKIIGIGRQVSGLHKSGRVFPLALAVSEVSVNNQHHFTGIVRDLTDQVKVEEEARIHRERLAHFDRISTMGEMATGIAHEINQPLTAIASYARACHRLIDAGLGEPAELLATLDKISNQAQRAGDVIHRLRDFVKKRKTQREPCELNKLVADAIALAETDAREYNFAIDVALSENELPVIADPIQIEQVVLNLIRNAAEAMIDVAEPGDAVIVKISTALDDPRTAQVAVTDKGHGISDSVAEQLFDPFFTTKSSGTGIGLAISRTIVTSHGGRLWFEHNPNQGITMHFTLPLAIGDDIV